jgi:osmotically-inducible protein OsmY
MVRNIFIAALVCGIHLQSTANAETISAEHLSDAQITDHVTNWLAAVEPDIARRIRVSTVDGAVTLEGTLLTAAQELRVVRDVRSVTGVVKVRNRLILQM